MIIEEAVGITDTDRIKSLAPRTYTNTGWKTPSSNRIESDVANGILWTPQVAGFFMREFDTDDDDNTIPQSITAALIRFPWLYLYCQTGSEDPGETVCRMTPFLTYNTFNPSIVTFSDLYSWIYSDTESNEKFNILDFNCYTSSEDEGSVISLSQGPEAISTFNSIGESDLTLDGITSIGIMCEILSVDNLESDSQLFNESIKFYPNDGSFDSLFQYIP